MPCIIKTMPLTMILLSTVCLSNKMVTTVAVTMVILYKNSLLYLWLKKLCIYYRISGDKMLTLQPCD